MDETGQVKITLWNDEIGFVKKASKITNDWVKEWNRSSRHLPDAMER